MLDSRINKCTCGSNDIVVKCTSSSHYAEDYVECQTCLKQGAGEFGIHDAIQSWNRITKPTKEITQ